MCNIIAQPKENVIEFLNGQQEFAATFNSKKFINKAQALRANASAFVENQDGSIYCRFPLSYLRISKPRELSEEQRQAAADRLAAARRL